jgi:hypothetical protein
MILENFKPSIILSLIFIIVIAIMFQNNCVNGICTIIKPTSKDNVKTILFSIIWGIGLSTLYKKTCKNGSCVVVNKTIKDILKNGIYYTNNKCFYLEKTKC